MGQLDGQGLAMMRAEAWYVANRVNDGRTGDSGPGF
jgi:hypothetical protein